MAGHGFDPRRAAFGNPEVVDLWSETTERETVRQTGCHRREDIPTVEGVAHLVEKVPAGLYLAGLADFGRFHHVRDDAVIGGQKHGRRGLDRDNAPVTADSWIHDRNMNRGSRKVGHGLRPEKPALLDILRVDPMGEVLARVESNNVEGIAAARIPIASFRKNRRIPQYTTAFTQTVFEQYQPEIPMDHLDLPVADLPQNGKQMKQLLDGLSRWLNPD